MYLMLSWGFLNHCDISALQPGKMYCVYAAKQTIIVCIRCANVPTIHLDLIVYLTLPYEQALLQHDLSFMVKWSKS